MEGSTSDVLKEHIPAFSADHLNHFSSSMVKGSMLLALKIIESWKFIELWNVPLVLVKRNLRRLRNDCIYLVFNIFAEYFDGESERFIILFRKIFENVAEANVMLKRPRTYFKVWSILLCLSRVKRFVIWYLIVDISTRRENLVSE